MKYAGRTSSRPSTPSPSTVPGSLGSVGYLHLPTGASVPSHESRPGPTAGLYQIEAVLLRHVPRSTASGRNASQQARLAHGSSPRRRRRLALGRRQRLPRLMAPAHGTPMASTSISPRPQPMASTSTSTCCSTSSASGTCSRSAAPSAARLLVPEWNGGRMVRSRSFAAATAAAAAAAVACLSSSGTAAAAAQPWQRRQQQANHEHCHQQPVSAQAAAAASRHFLSCKSLFSALPCNNPLCDQQLVVLELGEERLEQHFVGDQEALAAHLEQPPKRDACTRGGAGRGGSEVKAPAPATAEGGFGRGQDTSRVPAPSPPPRPALPRGKAAGGLDVQGLSWPPHLCVPPSPRHRGPAGKQGAAAAAPPPPTPPTPPPHPSAPISLSTPFTRTHPFLPLGPAARAQPA